MGTFSDGRQLKTCRCCKTSYTLEQFTALPTPPGGGSKVTYDTEEKRLYRDLFRNCTCGSTLMETFEVPCE